MRYTELTGRIITEVWEQVEMETGGLDRAACIVLLDGRIPIGFPYAWDDEIHVHDASAIPPGFTPLRGNVRRHIVGQTITGLIGFDEGGLFDKALLVLANGSLIGEINIAPNGTGHAGLWFFRSLAELELRAGTDHRNLIAGS
jgi:hypothetical protein